LGRASAGGTVDVELIKKTKKRLLSVQPFKIPTEFGTTLTLFAADTKKKCQILLAFQPLS
jgi:hypothetical protein